ASWQKQSARSPWQQVANARFLAREDPTLRRLLDRLKARARGLKRDTLALYLAARDPRTPWYAKLLAAAVVAYALSPLDLIPDFIPVLGYLDDLIIVPLGIPTVLRMVPAEVLAASPPPPPARPPR